MKMSIFSNKVSATVSINVRVTTSMSDKEEYADRKVSVYESETNSKQPL